MAVSGKVILLKNDQALRALDASGDAVSLFKLDSSSKLQLLKLPQVSADPSSANDLARKSFIDAQLLIRDGRIDAVEGDVSTLEGQMSVVQGDDSTAGSIAKAKKDAQDYVDQKISDLVNGAPQLLDTLQELAAAIGNDPSIATTIANSIGLLDGRLDVLEGDELTSGSVANAVKAERDRAQAAEGILDGRLDTAEGDIDALEVRMGSAETAIQNLASSSAIVDLDARVDQLEADMPTKASQSDLDALEGRVDSAEASLLLKASQASVDSLEQAVIQNGIDISSLQGQVDGKAASSWVQQIDTQNQQDHAGFRQRMDDIEGSVAQKASQSDFDLLEGRVDTAEGDIDALEGRMGSAESSIALKASQADLDSVEGRVDTAESDIDSLESRMGSAETALSSLASSSAIVELDGRIDVLEAAMPLKAAQSDLEQEIQDREDADAALGVRIDNILSNTTPGSLDSLVEVVQAFEQADQNLNNAITSLASSASSALQSEVTRATQAEQALSDAIALKAAKTYVDSQDQAILAAAKDYSDELAAGMTYMHELHVNFDFEGTSDGSPMKPFKTIQDAVDAAVSMNQGANNHIMVHNPADTVISESIVINNAVTNLFIEGLAHVKDGAAVRINGSITIQGNSNRVRLKGLQIMSASAATPALSVVGTPGRHIFEKCAFEVGGVSFSGSYANWASFEDCSFEGPVSFAGSPAANTLITMYRSFAGSADVVVNSANVIVSIMDTYSMKSITHSAGTVAVDNLRSIGSAGIVSTASAGLLSLTRVSMQQPDLSFAPINKSGAALYQLISVHRGETADVLSGTRVAYGPTATDQGYKMGVSGNWASAVYAVGPALDSLAANKASSASVTSGLAGKASTTLNNLGVTSINADLLPSATGTRALGSSTLGWQVGWFTTVRGTNFQGTGGPAVFSSQDNNAATGAVTLKSGNATIANVNSGSVTIGTGTVSGTGARGDIILDASMIRPATNGVGNLGSGTYQYSGVNARVYTLYDGGGNVQTQMYFGNDDDSVAYSGVVQQASGKALGLIGSNGGGAIRLRTKNNASGASGDIVIKTGTATTTRGKVSVDALSMDMNSAKIVGVADPTSAQDASTKSYTDTQRDAAKSYADAQVLVEKNRALGVESGFSTRLNTIEALKVQQQAYEKFTLGSGDLSSISVSATIKGTPWVMREGVMGIPGSDFTFSGSTITFAGEWINPSGTASVEVGDEIFVFYMKEVSAF